jgi:hypothetical protein
MLLDSSSVAVLSKSHFMISIMIFLLWLVNHLEYYKLLY